MLFGAEPLGGYMAGVCVSGVMWAIFQNNAGGAWDNAKKSFEASFNGKMRFTIELSLELKPKEIEEIIMNDDRTQQQLQGRTPKKVIVVTGKIINIVG